MESLPAAAAHRILACGGMKELGIYSQVSSTLATVAQLSFKTRARARYPSVEFLCATSGSDAVDWRGVYRRHFTIAARMINGQKHMIPPQSRAPTQAFDDYIFVVEAFEGQSAPGAPWGTGEGTGLMSNARSLGVARALPVLCGDSVKFRAEFSDQVFWSRCVRGRSMHVHGFIRVLVARASAPDKVCLFYENVAYDWGYYEDEYCADQNLLPGWEAFHADDGDGWWYYHAETDKSTWDKPQRERRHKTENGIYWALFGNKPVFDLVVDLEDNDVKIHRGIGWRGIDEPICGALYYANGVGEYDNSDERRGQDWSEKTTGSSIELTFEDKGRIPSKEPTAAEVLFRLEHFLVFE